MKKFLMILSIIYISLAGFSACEKDETQSDEKITLPEATIQSSKDTIEAAGGTFTLTVTTQAEYSIMTSRTSSGWLSQTSNADNQYTFAVAENASGTARFATVSVVDAEKLTLANYEVVQKANEIPEQHSFSVDPLKIDVEADATTASFNVTSDVDWTVVSSNSKFVVDKAKGSNNDKVTVTFPANTSSSAQTANIVVSSENKGLVTKTYTVVITQKGFTYTFGVDLQDIKAKDTDTTAVFNITGNVDWTIISDNAAFIASPVSGNGAATIKVKFPINVAVTEQVANLTVSTNNDGVTTKSYKVTITQSKAVSYSIVAKWQLNKASAAVLGANFTQTVTDAAAAKEGFADRYIDANVTGTGKIQYWAVDRTSINTLNTFRRVVGKYGEPVIYGPWVGDYWYVTATPTSEIAAGSSIKFQFATRSGDTGMKYWLMEYKDGTEWKPIKPTIHKTIDSQAFDYNFEYTGVEELSEVVETAVLSNPTSLIEFRMTCVANYRTDGQGKLDSILGGVVRFVGEEGSNMAVQSKTGFVISYGK